MELNKIDELMSMVKEIHHVVIGSDHDRESGLLHRVKCLEDECEKQQQFISKVKWIMIGMSAPASWGIIQFLSSLLIK